MFLVPIDPIGIGIALVKFLDRLCHTVYVLMLFWIVSLVVVVLCVPCEKGYE